MGSITLRVRSIVWFVTGVLLTTTATLMFANAWRVDAAPGDDDATFVSITPCRLADTRPAPARVATAGSLGVADTQTFGVHGSNGECTIPTEAVAVSLNVTALGATQQSFLTFWPDGAQPLASSLNPAPGEPPTPNAVTVDLSAAGGFNVYNDVGSVNVVIDVNGYYIQGSLTDLATRVATLETATAAGVDPAVLQRLDTLETTTGDLETATADLETATAVLDASQPFTVASEPVNFVDVLATATATRQVTVTAPVAGHVATIASGSMFEFTDGQIVQCGLMDSVTLPPDDVGVFWQSPTGGNESHVSASRVFTIAAGETATYTLVCRNTTGGTSTIRSPQVTAIFTPAP